MYGCTTLVADPVKVGADAARVPAPCVWPVSFTVWVRVADGLPDVTALFVTAWASTAPLAFVGTPAGHAIVPAGVPALLASDSATAADVVFAVGVNAPCAALLVPVPNVVEGKCRILEIGRAHV